MDHRVPLCGNIQELSLTSCLFISHNTDIFLVDRRDRFRYIYDYVTIQMYLCQFSIIDMVFVLLVLVVVTVHLFYAKLASRMAWYRSATGEELCLSRVNTGRKNKLWEVVVQRPFNSGAGVRQTCINTDKVYISQWQDTYGSTHEAAMI